MNINTNELRDIKELSQEDLSQLSKEGFTPVPEHLQKDAELVLDGQLSAIVPKNSKSSLAKWANEERKRKRTKEEHELLRNAKAFAKKQDKKMSENDNSYQRSRRG